jgi:CBS domain-containing protein
MNTRHAHVRRCTIYDRSGEPLSEACELPIPADDELFRTEPAAERVSIRHIMSNEVVCARPDLEVGAAMQLMLQHRIGCLPIVDHRRKPVGVITKLDLIEQVEAALPKKGGSAPSGLRVRLAEDVMMPLALTLTESASVAHAATMMSMEGTHHVLVVSADDRRLVGIVSSKDIVDWLAGIHHTDDVSAPPS